MTARVDVPSELIVWARERSGITTEELARHFPRLHNWERGELQPTLKQLEAFANRTHTPIGYFFLPKPPDEPLPLPDFRTFRDTRVARPSADLLDTIYECQQRQEWYRDYALSVGDPEVDVVGSLSRDTPVAEAAAELRAALRFDVAERGGTWSEAFRRLADNAEALGILVMVNGVVGSNTRRRLDPREFRGFALVDRVAPVVFVNGADTKAAQVFTLSHELAHLWLGESALDDADSLPVSRAENVQGQREATERWCNQVAAEFLLPLADVGESFRSDVPLQRELDRLARQYKVSTLVALGRIYGAGQLGWDGYRAAYEEERGRVLELLRASSEEGGGGNFYNTQPVRTSKRFARAVVTSTLEGQTLHRDAFRLLGFNKVSTFYELAKRLGAA